MNIRLPRSPVSPISAGALALTLLLAACAEGQFGASGGQPGTVASVKLIEQEVERSDIFQVTDRGLWDGRPSLGGLWVAHVGAEQPERVIIVNTATGAEIKGALFRREPGSPGPAFQLSSSVAAALGILAGVPTEVRVTAIRRETIEVVTSEPAAAVEPVAESSGQEGSTLDPISASEILAVPVPVATAAPKPKPPEPQAEAALAAPEAIEDAAVPEEPEAAQPPAPVQAATFDAGTAVPAKPYIQVATLSTAERADALVARLEKAGMSAARKPSGSGDDLKYIVVVGPIATVAKAQAYLTKIRGMGFKDAFPSRGL